jgi:hypothetical protein
MEKMTKQTFYVEQNNKVRSIELRVEKEYITFHFKSEGGREFYSIPTKSWANDTGKTWRKHMADKNWFTPEMATFLDGTAGSN